MKFSERKGYKDVSNIIQTEGINEDLKNSLWNVLYECIWTKNSFRSDNRAKPAYWHFSKVWYQSYLKKQIDTMSSSYSVILGEIKKDFFKVEWYEIYDFLEFTLNYFEDNDCNKRVNEILEKELSGYRYVNGVFSDITNQQEIEMLENTLTDEDFPNVKAHLQRALELLSDRKNPDYRNSIKESISAVESIAKEIAKKPKAELAEALKEIEKNGELHGALKKGFLSLYGYTSDANGIRHSLMEEPNLTADDAKFFLLVCTSFINYLKTKI